MRNTVGIGPNWLLFWNGLAALVVMAILVAAQVTPPPVLQNVSLAIGVCILGLLFLGVGNLAVFAWKVLCSDAGSVSTPTATLRSGLLDARDAVTHILHIGA